MNGGSHGPILLGFPTPAILKDHDACLIGDGTGCRHVIPSARPYEPLPCTPHSRQISLRCQSATADSASWRSPLLRGHRGELTLLDCNTRIIGVAVTHPPRESSPHGGRVQISHRKICCNRVKNHSRTSSIRPGNFSIKNDWRPGSRPSVCSSVPPGVAKNTPASLCPPGRLVWVGWAGWVGQGVVTVKHHGQN